MKKIYSSKIKKTVSVMISTLLFLSMSLQSFAVVPTSVKAKQIMNDYSVLIDDQANLLNSSNETYFLSQIQKGLDYYGKDFFVNNSEFLKDEFNADFVIELNAYKPNDPLGEYTYPYYSEDGETTHAIVSLYDTPDAKLGGIANNTVAHEMGHYLHDLFAFSITEDELDKLWAQYSHNPKYDTDWIPSDANRYVNQYGKSDVYEDVATIIEELLVNPQEMLKRISDPKAEVLYNKVYLILYLSHQFLEVTPAGLEPLIKDLLIDA